MLANLQKEAMMETRGEDQANVPAEDTFNICLDVSTLLESMAALTA